MTTRVSTSLRNLAFLSIAAAGLTFAQTASTGAMTGTYVFSERGNATTTLASLTLAADGSDAEVGAAEIYSDGEIRHVRRRLSE